MSSAPPPLPRFARPPLDRSAFITALAIGQHLWHEVLVPFGPRRLAAIGLVLVLIASPWPHLTVAALAAYVLLTLKQPGLTVALLPLSAPFAYVPKDLFGPDFPVVELLLLVALLTGALQLVARWRGHAARGAGAATLLDAWDTAKAFLGGGFGPHALALGLLGAFSLLTIADPEHLRESVREYRTVVFEPLLYFFLASYWLRNRRLRDLAQWSFITGAALVALIGVGQFLTGANVVVADGASRAIGAYRHPNALALYLGRALPFALALLALAPDPRALRAAQGARPALIAAPVVALGFLLTFSRGAFAGLAVALVALALLARRRDVRLALLGAVLVGAILLFALAGGRLAALASGDGSVELRLLIWDATIAMIRDHPAFGVGLDQFYYQYAPRYIEPAAWGERYTSHPHNLFLDFWVRLGIMGLAWIAWVLGTLGARLIRGWRHATGDDDRRVVVAAGVAALAAVVHGAIDNFYFLIDLAFIWWFLLALAQIAADRPEAAATAAGSTTDAPDEPAEGW